MSEQTFERAQARVLERYGVTAESRYVAVPEVGGAAHVLVAGEGPPVLLVNGANTPAAMWAPLMAELHGFTLYAVDRPGCGLTPAVPVTTATVRSHAVRFLEQVLDGLGLERAVILANSMGSLWSTWLALEQPRRVVAMAHVGTPACILGTSAPLPMRLLSVPPLGRFLMALQPPSVRQMDQVAAMVHVELFKAPEVREVMVEGEKLPGHAAGFLSLLHACLRLRGPRPEVELTAVQLSEVRQPVLLIWPEDDPFGTPATGQRAAEILPDGECHTVPGGHAPWVNHPHAVAAVAMPFLRRHACDPAPQAGTDTHLAAGMGG